MKRPKKEDFMNKDPQIIELMGQVPNLIEYAIANSEYIDWLEAERKNMNYENAILKFDNSRACLARMAEHLKLRVNPPDDYDGAWHEWLIGELDTHLKQ